jgi:hypothetical protein
MAKPYVVKLRDGFSVMQGQDALVSGLREKQDAHRICYDLLRKGYFRGTVIFARNGRALDITVPADANIEQPTFNVDDPVDRGEGTVDDL